MRKRLKMEIIDNCENKAYFSLYVDDSVEEYNINDLTENNTKYIQQLLRKRQIKTKIHRNEKIKIEKIIKNKKIEMYNKEIEAHTLFDLFVDELCVVVPDYHIHISPDEQDLWLQRIIFDGEYYTICQRIVSPDITRINKEDPCFSYYYCELECEKCKQKMNK